MLITLDLPWPDKRLLPNSKRRNHWRSYSPVAKQARLDAHLLMLDAMQSAGIRPDMLEQSGKQDVRITFYPPDRRRRDDDGMVGSIKHARDGIADALGRDDVHWRPHYLFADPEPPGRVVFEIDLG